MILLLTSFPLTDLLSVVAFVEMGLGKTIQTAAFVNIVASKLNRPGPVLIVAPLSTATNWMREFQRWTDLNTVLYHGTAADRRIIRELEMAYEVDRPKGSAINNQSYLAKCGGRSNSSGLWMAQVVVTTPEMMIADDAVQFSHIKWEVLVVDEAHRMKNHASKVSTGLRDGRFVFNHKILLTGTPIQVRDTACVNVVALEALPNSNSACLLPCC